MKNLYLTSTGRIVFDKETDEVRSITSDREGVHNIYLIDEPMHVVYNAGETKIELDVEPNDILITFYEKMFPLPIVVAKSEAWAENIKAYRENEQKAKEQWAKEKQLKEYVGDCADPTSNR